MKTKSRIELDRRQLLGFKLDADGHSATKHGAKLGGKPAPKLGAKFGAKVGQKPIR